MHNTLDLHSLKIEDDGHGVGAAFTMDSKPLDNQNSNLEYDENFDPLGPDNSFSIENDNTQGDKIYGRNRKRSPDISRLDQNTKKDKHYGEPCEEEDEEVDYFVEERKYLKQ